LRLSLLYFLLSLLLKGSPTACERSSGLLDFNYLPCAEIPLLEIMAIFKKTIKEAAVSQSLVGRANANKQHGILGMLHNPYVFMTCLFASLGCMMYGYDQGVMGSILVMQNFEAYFPSLTGSHYTRLACVCAQTWSLV
jgi:hypothetical protein